MTYIIGIDPGIKGGVGVLDTYENLFVYDKFSMPLNRPRIDTTGLSRRLEFFGGSGIAYVEKQHVRGNQGGNFTIGVNYGRILAVLEMLHIPYTEVDPKTWQSRMLAAELYQCNGDTKEAAIMYCHNQGWNVPRRSGRSDSPFNDGISDALVIAAYGTELARQEAMRA